MCIHASFTRTLTLLALLAASLFMLAPAQPADAQTPAETTAVNAPVGSAFSYQGRLTDNGNPANGAYDFQFILYDAATGGAQQGSTVTQSGVAVSNGLFNVQLDFGQAVFNGDARFLEVGVKQGTGAYTVLSPRTALTAAPYALGMPGVVAQDGKVGIGTASPQAKLHIAGNTHVDGTLLTAGLAMTANDFLMLANERGDGGRALVHGGGDTLIVNFTNDFAGGTVVESSLRTGPLEVQGHVKVNGDVQIASNELIMLPNDRGDGGRAVVHWINDTLVLNFDKDFAGGVEMGGPLLVYGGDVRVSGGNFIDDGTTLNVPDYVFEEDYPLLSLDELAAYIAREKHLPGVPSAAEIARDGLNLSEFHMRLLEKVEELTLYTLAQQEQIEALEARLAALEAGR